MDETIYAQEFIHAASIGDHAACLKALREIGVLLKRDHAEGLHRGHQVYLIASEADRSTNFLEADVEPFTGGRYPYLYAFIQPTNGDGEVVIDRMMASHGYVRVA